MLSIYSFTVHKKFDLIYFGWDLFNVYIKQISLTNKLINVGIFFQRMCGFSAVSVMKCHRSDSRWQYDLTTGWARQAREWVKDSWTEVFLLSKARPSKMSKPRTSKKEKISVASEIDRIEERRLHSKHNLERAEFRQRKQQLSDNDRLALEDEITLLNERIQKYEKELQVLWGENRENMMLSVALLAISALFYYSFIY